ncbi:MAG: DUF1269 domain-containing protein, partial [Dehalococcoidia bacterium]
MTNVPVEVIVAAFKDELAADEALWQLKELQKDKVIRIEDAAVLRKDSSGKLHLKETADMGAGKGAAIGGVTGAVIGLLAGPVGLVAGAGALIGGLAAKLRDSGFSDARLKRIGESLTPGSSAIVAVIEHSWVAEVERAMAEAGADVVTESLSKDIAAQLQAGGDVAYTAVATGDALVTTRAAVSDERAEVSRTLATEAGVYAEGVVVTNDSVVAGAAVATDDMVEAVVVEAGPKQPNLEDVAI